MFSKIALFAAASMAVFVSAAPGGAPSYGYGSPSYGGGAAPPSGDINNSCNSGPVQCCT